MTREEPTAPDRVTYQRAYQSARQRALNRLAQAHLGEYAALLAEERVDPQDAAAAHAERLTRLERERVRFPDRLEAERDAPGPAENGYWNRPASSRALNGQDND